MVILLTAIVGGIGLGSLYALVAMSYTLVLASSRVFNFAQGSIVMVGAFALLILWAHVGIPLLLVLALTIGVGAALGLLSEVVAVRPMRMRKDAGNITEATIVTTLGLGIVINSVMGVSYGYDTYPVKDYVTENPIMLGSIPVRPIYVVMFVTTLAIVIAAETVVRRTGVGLALRAAVEDAEGAATLGINVGRIMWVSFTIAGAVAAISGVLMAPVTFASPYMGIQVGLYGFAGIAIGGFGSFRGALVGGLLVGVTAAVASVYVQPALIGTVVYLLLLGVLLVRPRGLFGTGGAFGAARIREV